MAALAREVCFEGRVEATFSLASGIPGHRRVTQPAAASAIRIISRKNWLDLLDPVRNTPGPHPLPLANQMQNSSLR